MLGTVDYEAALGLQAAMVAARQAGDIGDTMLLLEHPHVFTLGRGADAGFLLDSRPVGVPVHRVSRGGQVTYHGPGQLVGYPIIKLEGRERDVSLYLRRLEQTMIDALAAHGIEATRRPGLTGAWVGARKIASIGVGIKRWVTCHGFALNVCPDLRFFAGIVPCGIHGCEMTSVTALGHAEVGVSEMSQSVREAFCKVFGYDAALDVGPHDVWRLIEDSRNIETATVAQASACDGKNA